MIEEHLSSDMNLTLGSKDGDHVTRRLLVGKPDGRVGLGLDVVNEDALLSYERTMVPPRNRDRFDDKVLVLETDELHDGLLEVLEVETILRGRPRNDVVLVISVPSERCKLLGVLRIISSVNQRGMSNRGKRETDGELDVDAILLHDSLNVLASDANDPLVIRLGNMERDLSRQLLLQHRESMKGARITSREVNEEIVVVERLKLDFDVPRLDLVQFPILLTRDKVAVIVGEFELETNLVVESL